MRFPGTLLAGCMLLAIGCGVLKPGSSEKVLSIDKSVDQATADRLGALLLLKVPAIRTEQAARRQQGSDVELIIRVENAPQTEYTGPDKPFHRNYYWMYVGFHRKGSILKHSRYLIHKDPELKDGSEILLYDDTKDAFLPPSESTAK